MSTMTEKATASAAPAERAVEELSDRIHGEVIRPGHDHYDEARQVWNGMIQKRPACIVRCAGVADVVDAVNFARDNDLVVAVRGGGHNVAGNAVCDGGVVIDLSGMRSVRVDRAASTVRAEGGAQIGDLDRAAQVFGLAVPLGVASETGIAGLTLGGGMGWLRRKYGLSCDNLVSLDIVTADGRVVTASKDNEPDLFWAVRGGGGNFGVVTSFEFAAYPIGPEVFFAFVVHAGEKAAAALRDYRAWDASVGDDVSSFAILWHVPEIDEIPAEYHGRPCVVYLAMYAGSAERGAHELADLRALGSPIADLSGPMPYRDVQKFFDPDYPKGNRYYWKSRYIEELPDEAIEVLVELNEQTPSHESTIDVWQLGGALSRVDPDATAFGDRSAAFLLGIEANWEDPDDDEACLEWARRTFAAIEPWAAPGGYLNFPGFYEDDSMVRETFGDNLARLARIKTAYDPTNLFRLNQNVHPG